MEGEAEVMRYGSVCSGIEAASAAWHSLGWHASFFSEIEPFPRAVLTHRYPSVPLHGDFTTIESNQYEPIDILVGGTPCQSFSVAGLRGGLADDRGNLASLEWPSAAAVCSLSDTLETGDVPQRFYLSATACRGILRRAEKRGKVLPKALQQALLVSSQMTNAKPCARKILIQP